MESNRCSTWSGGAAVAVVALAAGLAFAGGKHKLKPTVNFAKNWEEAVSEARLLNVPIVLHSHGFYCPPCWGMHSSLLQNEKYIKFADKSTVEVISLSRLQEGIDKQDKRAETYTVEENGQEVSYLVEFPGMTVETMLELNKSKAGTYNDTGKIPFTALIDPWTEKEITRWSGGQAAKTIMEAVDEATKALQKEHGKGISRQDVRDLAEAEGEAKALVDAGDYAKAIQGIDKLDVEEWPQEMQDRHRRARQAIVDAATQALDAIEARSLEDAPAAKRDLAKMASKLRGTGLEGRAAELQREL